MISAVLFITLFAYVLTFVICLSTGELRDFARGHIFPYYLWKDRVEARREKNSPLYIAVGLICHDMIRYPELGNKDFIFWRKERVTVHFIGFPYIEVGEEILELGEESQKLLRKTCQTVESLRDKKIAAERDTQQQKLAINYITERLK